MKLENSFTVRASLDETWALLTDLERVAPCLPGAELIGRDGDTYRGRVKVKLGPVLAQYEGKAGFVERDDAAKRGVLRAEGRETKGQGSARATVTAALAPVPEGTRVTVEIDLAIVGRLAQMGRGLIAEVSGKLFREFAANLERELAAGAAPASSAPASSAPGAASAAAPAGSESASAPPAAQPRAPSTTPVPPKAQSAPREPAPVDLLATAGVPVLKRVIPLAIGAALLVAAALWLL
jgi:uncharacterized protein